MARLARYAWPTLTLVWLVALAAASTGSSVGGPAVLPAMVLPALLLAAVALMAVSIVDTPTNGLAATSVSLARRALTVSGLRSCDPDAAGRPRPRAPSV
jgi:hypothetical protein